MDGKAKLVSAPGRSEEKITLARATGKIMMPKPRSNLVTEGEGSVLAFGGEINSGVIKNNGIDTAFIRYEESRGKQGASSHAKQQESNSSSQVRA